MWHLAISSAVQRFTDWVSQGLNQIVKAWLQPAAGSPLGGASLDLNRSRVEFIAENALLRHQLIELNRGCAGLYWLPKIIRNELLKNRQSDWH